MKRIQLFEFGDLNWFPAFLRNYMTDFLQFLSNKAKVYASVLEQIEETLKETNNTKIIDLCSGGGGGLLWLGEELKRKNSNISITLSDYYPNIGAFEHITKNSEVFEYEKSSVDARAVPSHLKGLRTQFLSFHHFKPADAQLILQNAVDSQQAIAIFEIQDRSVPSIIAMLLSPLSVLFTTPFIRPFSIGRLIFTYIIPIVPLIVVWDGLVSSFRTYSVNELNDLVTKLKNKDTFNWKIEKKKDRMGFVIYLIGVPK
jgi:hypothetical protein